MSDQEKDPVVHSSLSKQLFIWSVLLVLSLVWGLYDEIYGTRPWKSYQADFQRLYSKLLVNAKPGARNDEASIKATSTYKQLDAQYQAALKAAEPRAKEVEKQVNDVLVPKILALNTPFQDVR